MNIIEDAITAYDIVAYPTTVIPSTHPERLATVARLHGMAPADIATARVLELGGGDAMNMIALAVAYPQAQFVSIDLAPAPVARGRQLARLLGLSNIDIRVGNIVSEAGTITGTFDYVVAHGVYAWVPEPVRTAIMRLIGRVLAPQGVAFVSYNALPGGYLRLALRDMMLHALHGVDDPVERLERSRAFLLDYARPRDPDLPATASLRAEAAEIARKNQNVLHHDELGAVFAPQSLTDVVAAANAHGLSYLNEAQAPSLGDGLLLDEDDASPTDEAAIVRRAQAVDHATMRFFAQTLLVRSDALPSRRLDPATVHGLWLATAARRTGPTRFELRNGSFAVDDGMLADALATVADRSPARTPVAGLLAVDDDERLHALVELYRAGAVTLHSTPYPAVADSQRPLGSPLARAMVASGQEVVVTLDHAMLHLEDPGARAFLMLLDGTRDRAALNAVWRRSPHAATIDADEALRTLARFALLVA